MGSQWLIVNGLSLLWQHAGRPDHLRVLQIALELEIFRMQLIEWGQLHCLKMTVIALDNHIGTLRYAASALRCVPQVTLVRANGPLAPL